jgi:hypothetical protein
MMQKTWFSRAICFFVLCAGVLCLFTGCAGQDDAAAGPEALTMADLIQEDGTFQFPGVPAGTAREDFTDIFGMDYSEYGDTVDAAYASGNSEDAPFLLEGRPAAVVFPLKDGKVRSVVFYMMDDGASAEDWLESSLNIRDALEQAAVSSSLSSYELENASVTLDWGPCDSAEAEQLEDGQTGWTGEIGTLGTRITMISVNYHS